MYCKVLIVYSFIIISSTSSYPISGSWFKDTTNPSSLEMSLSLFKKIGSDVVLKRGAKFLNRTAEEVKSDSTFSDCIINGHHCVDETETNLTSQGINIKMWLTYSNEDDYSDNFIKCKGFDNKIVIGKKVYMRIVLWTEFGKTDCSFTNGSNVAVMFTYYSGEDDPHSLLLHKAAEKNMSVYLGLAKVPYIREDQPSADMMQAYYGFVYRIILDHQKKYNNTKSLKGYYSDEEVVPSYIVKPPAGPRNTNLPANYTLWFWRELMFLAGSAGFEMVSAPTLDLTRTSNTTLKSHITGLQALMMWTAINVTIRDGRGEGTAAYYTEEEANLPIYSTDNSLWKILKQKNSSITEKTKFTDVYYASINQFLDQFRAAVPHKTIWFMIEAYDNIAGSSWCTPVDPKGSGMDRKVQRIHKDRLDKAIATIGTKVNKITAFAWDPLFLCKEPGENSLLEEIENSIDQPIISECRFHSQQNQSIVVIGFKIDGTYEKFKVTYKKYTGESETTYLYGYYYELDYGKEHHLIDSLVYIQLFDIPNLKDLQRNGTITVQADGANDSCSFNYILNQNKNNKKL